MTPSGSGQLRSCGFVEVSQGKALWVLPSHHLIPLISPLVLTAALLLFITLSCPLEYASLTAGSKLSSRLLPAGCHEM